MATCEARLGLSLSCVRPDPHTSGHCYESGTGSWVDDRHAEGGHG